MAHRYHNVMHLVALVRDTLCGTFEIDGLMPQATGVDRTLESVQTRRHSEVTTSMTNIMTISTNLFLHKGIN